MKRVGEGQRSSEARRCRGLCRCRAGLVRVCRDFSFGVDTRGRWQLLCLVVFDQGSHPVPTLVMLMLLLLLLLLLLRLLLVIVAVGLVGIESREVAVFSSRRVSLACPTSWVVALVLLRQKWQRDVVGRKVVRTAARGPRMAGNPRFSLGSGTGCGIGSIWPVGSRLWLLVVGAWDRSPGGGVGPGVLHFS